jgi:hypothetical protein
MRPQRGLQFLHRALGIEARLLALGVERHRAARLLRAQVQRVHDRAGGCDLLLGHAAVGLGDVPHHAEAGREEQPIDARGRGTRPDGAGRGIVELVPQHHAERCAPGAERHQPEGATDDLSVPTHARP